MESVEQMEGDRVKILKTWGDGYCGQPQDSQRQPPLIVSLKNNGLRIYVSM